MNRGEVILGDAGSGIPGRRTLFQLVLRSSCAVICMTHSCRFKLELVSE